MRRLREWARAVVSTGRLLWIPDQCASCHARIDGPGVCAVCLTQLGREDRAFSRGRLRVGGLYRGVWQHLVQSYKEEPSAELPPWIWSRLRDLGRESGPDPVLLPVPMHRVRRRERGINPAEALARGLGAGLGWPVETQWLRRVRYRRPLRGLGAGARRLEMIGAIELTSAGKRGLGGRTVWLVDDVLTTGSTLDACFHVCGKADISGGGAYVLAWAPLDRDERATPQVGGPDNKFRVRCRADAPRSEGVAASA